MKQTVQIQAYMGRDKKVEILYGLLFQKFMWEK